MDTPSIPSTPLLVLDLDETLFHARETPWDGSTDLIWECYHFRFRPGLSSFLDMLSPHYAIAVWTSSASDYASAAVTAIFGSRTPVFLWARDRCTRHFDPELQQSHWIKNIGKLKRHGYRLERILCVDDSPEKHLSNYGNLVQIKPWEGDPADRELMALATYLVSIRDTPDFRRLDKRGWLSRQHLTDS